MPEKWAGFAPRTKPSAASLACLPRAYVAPFISEGRRRSLWIARAAVQRLARKMLSNLRPDVAGYTRAETSRGWASNLRFQGVGFSHFEASTQERLNDQVQARVYLARRVYADTEPARQNADQGIRLIPDAGTASAVGLRRLLDHAGGRQELGLRAQAGRSLSGRRTHRRRSGDVRSHDAGWRHSARDEQARHHS